MTDIVHPSFDRRARNREIAAAIRYAGGSAGWVVPSTTRLVEDSEGNVASGSLGAFNNTGSSGLDVSFDTGEALVDGAYLATDETRSVTLAASTANQTVYVGWRDGLADTIIIGLDDDFAAEDHQLPIWEFDTDPSSVTASSDVRNLDDYRILGSNIEDGTVDAGMLRGRLPRSLLSPVFGDESDGALTRSSDGTENGIVNTTSYTLEAGVTRTVSNGVVVIHSTGEIRIDGTLDAAAVFGAGGSSSDGTQGLLGAAGAGGAGGETADNSSTFGDNGGPGAGGGGGGTDSGQSGNDGGNAGGAAYTDTEPFNSWLSGRYDTTINLSALGGAGGGGGGDGANNSLNTLGGNGGGVVLLIARKITGSGAITAAGGDGQNGNDGQNNTEGGDGGGGGGSGGLIALFCSELDHNISFDVSAGTGGVGGSGGFDAADGGDGGDGDAGYVVETGATL